MHACHWNFCDKENVHTVFTPVTCSVWSVYSAGGGMLGVFQKATRRVRKSSLLNPNSLFLKRKKWCEDLLGWNFSCMNTGHPTTAINQFNSIISQFSKAPPALRELNSDVVAITTSQQLRPLDINPTNVLIVYAICYVHCEQYKKHKVNQHQHWQKSTLIIIISFFQCGLQQHSHFKTAIPNLWTV